MPKNTKQGASYAGHVDLTPADVTPEWVQAPAEQPAPKPVAASAPARPTPAPRARTRKA